MKILGSAFFYLTVVLLSLLCVCTVLFHIFQPDIKDQFLQSIRPYINADLEVDFVDAQLFQNFPQASVEMRGVKIGETYDSSGIDAFEVGSIYIAFDYSDLWQGHWRARYISLENANVRMKVDKHGETNYEFWKRDSAKTEESALSFDLDSVDVKNCQYSFSNDMNGFLFSTFISEGKFALHSDSSRTDIVVEAQFNIHDLNSGELAILKEKNLASKLGFTIKDGDVYSIEGGQLEVEGMGFRVDGTIDNSQEFVKTDLDIEGTQTELKDLVALSPGVLQGSLDDYQIEGGAFFNAKLRGEWLPHKSAGILVGFGIRNGLIAQKSTGLKFEAINLEGSYSNGKGRTPESSTLALRNISAKERQKLIKGKFTLQNFSRPYLDFNLNADLDLNRIHQLFQIPGIEAINGDIDADVAFKGLLSHLENPETIAKTDFSGDVKLKSLNILEEGCSSKWENLNGLLSFEKPFLMLSDVEGRKGGSDFILNGYVKNPFGFLADEQRLILMTDIESRKLDLQDFLVESDTTTSENESSVERWPNYLALSTNLECDLLIWDDLKAEKVKAKLNYTPSHLEIVSAQLTSMGGKMKWNGMVKEVLPDGYDVVATLETDSLNISSLFKDLDNFGQDYITHEHLKGVIAGAMNVSFETDADFDIMTRSFIADADIMVTEGEMIGFLPMMKIGNFMKVGHFEHIVFDTLQNHFFIKEEMIEVPKMDIRSNTLDMTLAGTHSFENVVDYHVKVNMKKLFMSQHKLNPLNFSGFEKTGRGGMNVFLLVKGPGDEPDISYDVMAAGAQLGDNMQGELKELMKAREKEAEMRKFRTDSMARYHRQQQNLRRRKAYKNAISN